MQNFFDKKYDFIASIGEDCACATYLKKNKLRTCSSPFDWLTNASLKTRLELINHDFEDFLKIEDLRLIDKKTLGHPSYDDKFHYYENIKNSFHFYHDFESELPLNISYPQVLAKYERRIERFYDKIKSSNDVLLVWLSHSKVTDVSMLKEMSRKLSNKFNKNINFLIVENDSNLKKGQTTEELTPEINIRIYRLDTASFEFSKNQTLGNIENCNKIFSQIKQKKPSLKQRILTFCKIVN